MGPYLTARTQLVALTAEELRRQAGQLGRTVWALPGQPLTPRLIEDVELWRAATGVDAADRRPLGPIQHGTKARTWQQGLESKVQSRIPARWVDMLARIHPEIHNDPYAAVLAHRVAALHQSGVPVSEIVTAFGADGPLPAEQPAAALWWRLSRHLNPAEWTVTHPTPSTNPLHVGDVSADNPAGTQADRPFNDLRKHAASTTEGRRDEQCPAPEATTTAANGVEVDDAAHDRDRPSRTMQKFAKGRWGIWANQANPALVASKHWQAIAGELDRLNPAVVDLDRLGKYIGMLSADVVLVMLKDHNDQEPADVMGVRRQHEAVSLTLTANERHRRNSSPSRPAGVPRR